MEGTTFVKCDEYECQVLCLLMLAAGVFSLWCADRHVTGFLYH